MGVEPSKISGRRGYDPTSQCPPAPMLGPGAGDLPSPQFATRHRAIFTLVSTSLVAAAGPSMHTDHWPSQSTPAIESRADQLSARDGPSKVSAPVVPAHVNHPVAPTSIGAAVSMVKELLEITDGASDILVPLRISLEHFMKVWDVYNPTAEVRDDFIELATKLAILNTNIETADNLGDVKLQKRLEAIVIAINQLAEAIEAKKDSLGLFSRAAQSMGDVTVVKIMFRRVTSLLEVFQFEPQTRVETLLLTVLERLNTSAQHDMTSVDVAQVIITHMDQQHRSNFERYQAILEQLNHGAAAGNDEIVINNNSNQNESHGPTDLENDNPNETELEVEGHGGGIVNNNSNVNRVVGGGGSSPGTESPSEEISRWPRIRVTNNNGNKNVVRRTKAQRL